MRSLLAAITIVGKMTLLGCFSFLVGGHCGAVEAAKVSPCHQETMGPFVEDEQGDSPCGQCETSVETWLEPITVPFMEEKDVPVGFTFLFHEQEVHIDEILFEPIKQPPGDLQTRVFQRIARSTQWRNTDC